MRADLAEVATRSAQPVQHWILSWRSGEQPTAAQKPAAEIGIFELRADVAGEDVIREELIELIDGVVGVWIDGIGRPQVVRQARQARAPGPPP